MNTVVTVLAYLVAYATMVLLFVLGVAGMWASWKTDDPHFDRAGWFAIFGVMVLMSALILEGVI